MDPTPNTEAPGRSAGSAASHMRRLREQIPQVDMLLALIAAARHASFTKGAEDLEISQPGLSRQIASLEDFLGIKLFERVARTVRLTPEGEELVARATPLLEEMARVTSNICHHHGTSGGRVRLGASESVAINNLPSILRPYLTAHRRVSLRLICQTSEVLPEMVAKGEIDIAVCAMERDHPDLTCHRLWDEEMVLVLPVSHTGRSRSILSYLNEDFILLPPTTVTRRLIDQGLAQVGAHLKIALEHDSPEVIKSMVLAGLGLAILPEPSVRRETRRGELAAWPLADLKTFRSIVAITDPRRQHWPAETQLIDALRRYGR